MNINLTNLLLTLPLISSLTYPVSSSAAKTGVASRPNEIQQDIKKVKRSKLPSMAKPALLGATGKSPVIKFKNRLTMPVRPENINIAIHNKTRSTNNKGSMPAYVKSSAINTGHGLQQGYHSVTNLRVVDNRKASGKNNKNNINGYLHVVMEVSKNGNVKVLSAVKVKGAVVNTKEALGDFIYNIKLANKGVLVQAIPDPFELRSFPGPEGSGQTGHHFEQAKTARLIVKIPTSKATLKQLPTIKMDLYKLKPGYQIQKINQTIFNKLKLDNRLKTVVKIPSLRLAPLIKQKMRLAPR